MEDNYFPIKTSRVVDPATGLEMDYLEYMDKIKNVTSYDPSMRSYNEQLLNAYLMGLLTKHLEWHEMFVLSKSYGLDGPKWSAKEIASKLKITGISAYVRVSEIKKKAVEKLIANVDHSQVLDYL